MSSPIQSPWMGVRSGFIRPSKGAVLVELLLLGLGALGGLALLLQQKHVPSYEETVAALKVLEENPDDPDANTTAGKYKAFVMGDYAEAMPYLKKSKDRTLKGLAEVETDIQKSVTPTGQVEIAEAWISGARRFAALSRLFYDRASHWYRQAWPRLEGRDKDRARANGLAMAVSRPRGISRKGLPSGWIQDPGNAGGESVLDGTVSKFGSHSVYVPPADPRVPGSGTSFRSELIPIDARTFEMSAHVLANETENAKDRIYVIFYDQNGRMISLPANFIPMDVPFWTKVSVSGSVPSGAVRAQFGADIFSKKGHVWMDDISLKFDDVESLKNPSFEGR